MAQAQTPNPKQITVIDLARDHLAVCSSSINDPLVIKFPPTAVADLEVIDPTQLEILIKTFITQQRLPPSPLIIVLSPNVYFEKDLTAVAESERAAITQEFLDIVPLSSASSKIFEIQNSQRLIVINRNLYESVKRAFEGQDFSVIAVIPAAVLANAKIPTELTAHSCRFILHRVDYLKENSFLSERNHSNFEKKRQRFFKAHQAMLGILSVMFVAFSITTTTIAIRRPTSKPVSASQSPLPPQTTPIATSLASPPAASPAASFSNLTLLILNGSGKEGEAARLRQRLETWGFASIQTANSPAASSQTLIVFSPSVTPLTRNAILDEIKKTYPNLASQENSQSQYDITVTIGKISP